MARQKNALRKHYVAVFNPANPTTAPQKADYKLLAKYIKTVNDETDEDTDDIAYYDGDGTPEEVVVSVKAGFSFEGSLVAEEVVCGCLVWSLPSGLACSCEEDSSLTASVA